MEAQGQTGAAGRSALMLSALELARRIEAGALSPRAVVELCAEAIATHENEIGAFAALDLDAARQRAEQQQLALLPLRGLPVGIKDIFDTADLPTAYGSPIYAGHRPKADAAMVMLIRRAGGLVLGKTVTTEFASLEPARTRNPRNPAHTPGGSSSGSAAAVAAGMLPLALGSQTGGSVIRPAAFCGVAGFKPSYRLLPTVGMKCFSWSLDTVGLFGASVPDVAFAAAAMSGRDLRVDGRPPQRRRSSRSCAPILAGRERGDAEGRRARRARGGTIGRTHQGPGAAADLRRRRSRASHRARL